MFLESQMSIHSHKKIVFALPLIFLVFSCTPTQISKKQENLSGVQLAKPSYLKPATEGESFNPDDATYPLSIPTVFSPTLTCMRKVPDKELLVLGDSDGGLWLFDLEKFELQRFRSNNEIDTTKSQSISSPITALAVRNGNKKNIAFSRQEDSNVYLLDIEKASQPQVLSLYTLLKHEYSRVINPKIDALTFSHDGAYLAVGVTFNNKDYHYLPDGTEYQGGSSVIIVCSDFSKGQQKPHIIETVFIPKFITFDSKGIYLASGGPYRNEENKIIVKGTIYDISRIRQGTFKDLKLNLNSVPAGFVPFGPLFFCYQPILGQRIERDKEHPNNLPVYLLFQLIEASTGKERKAITLPASYMYKDMPTEKISSHKWEYSIIEGNKYSSEPSLTSFNPTGRSVAICDREGVYIYDIRLKKLLLSIPQKDCKSVQFLYDGTLISARDSHRIFIWNVTNGRLISSINFFRDGSCLLNTPDGFYISFGNAERYAYMREEGLLFNLDLFKKVRENPEIIKSRFLNLETSKSLSKDHKPPPVGVPPKVTILTPVDGMKTQRDFVDISVRAEDLSHTISRIDISINGKILHSRGIKAKEEMDTTKEFANIAFVTTQIPLLQGENIIEAWCINQIGVRSPKGRVTVYCKANLSKPKLWILAIGITDYKEATLDLRYAKSDAEAIAKKFINQKGKLYSEVSVKMLLDKEATRENILESEREFLSQASAQDVVIIFLAGHAQVDDRSDYYFLTYDATNSQPYLRGLGKSQLISMVQEHVPSQKCLLFLDTCFAGSISTTTNYRASNSIVEELRRSTGVYVLSASTSRENALEREGWNHGAFTFALLESLDGKGDSNGDGLLTVFELFNYLDKRVIEITKGVQHPIIPFAKDVRDFPFYQIAR